MNLFEELLNVYSSSITNLFTITGNVNDINIYNNEKKIVSKKLLEDLSKKNHVLVYSPSNGISFFNEEHKDELYSIDKELKAKHDIVFKSNYANSQYNVIAGLHILKTLLITYQSLRLKHGNKIKNLIIYLDNSDIIFPTKPIEQMNIDEKLAISLMREITNDYNFMNGKDVIIMSAESYFSINEEIRDLPMNHRIHVDLPSYETRLNFIKFSNNEIDEENQKNIALKTAGLNLITISTILKKGLEYIKVNLNKDVASILANKLGQHVELIYPKYGFDNIIGYDNIKEKCLTLIKRMNSINSWRTLCYVGPTGSGKDFHSEAFLFEAKLPVLKLKTIKSKWYGETSIILENIKQVARSFDKVIIFKPEADKLFPDPEDKNGHQTDQELAGLFLDWMSDSNDKGKIFWLFNTSRPQMFPVDFQRRVEIKIPILDITNKDDKFNFIVKMFETKNIDIKKIKVSNKMLEKFKFSQEDKKSLGNEYVIQKIFNQIMENFSSDNIRMIVNEVASELEFDKNLDIIEFIQDINVSVVVQERAIQTQYAKEYSTFKSLANQ